MALGVPGFNFVALQASFPATRFCSQSGLLMLLDVASPGILDRLLLLSFLVFLLPSSLPLFSYTTA